MKNDEKTNVKKNTNVKVKKIECNECEDDIEIDDAKLSTLDDKYYCESCYYDKFFECSWCNEEKLQENCYDTRYNGTICQDCYDNRFWTCNNCDTIYLDNESCDNCDDDDECSIPERPYYTGKKYCQDNSRTFSCEIECYYPNAQKLHETIEEIPAEIGICEDGSLDSKGIEFNTPILSGKNGFKLLKDFTDILNKNEFTVNQSCGLHIHLGGKDICENEYILQKMMIFFMVFEDVIMSFLPESRRENSYCLPLSEFYHLKEIKETNSIEDFEILWYREKSKEQRDERKKDRHDRSRYCGINFHSLLANGHLEIRYHSGTINYEKISNWIKLFVLILDKIVDSSSGSYGHQMSSRLNTPTLLKTKFILSLPEKTKTFFEMIDLPKELQDYFLKRQKLFSVNEQEEN